jgi:hypothetical protein
MESCKDLKDFKDFEDLNDLNNNKPVTGNRPGRFPGHEKTRRI